jgi:hypothetical protein
VRSGKGKITSFDPVGSTGTTVVGINNSGVITGFYSDGSATHGFVRDVDGNITAFDAPKSVDTEPNAINDTGAITGYFADKNGAHGFLRLPQSTPPPLGGSRISSTIVRSLATSATPIAPNNCNTALSFR